MYALLHVAHRELEEVDENGGASVTARGVAVALLHVAPRELEDLDEDSSGRQALPGGQELDQVVWQERWFLSGGQAGTLAGLDDGNLQFAALDDA